MAVVCLVPAADCDSSGKIASSDEPRAASEDSDESELDRELRHKRQPARKHRATDGEEPSGCTKDSECSGYLRCLGEGRCQMPPAITGKHTDSTPRATVHLRNSEQRRSVDFWLEIADTPTERSRGLMYRQRMRDDWGMLFIYPREDMRHFWMKNTRLPLDMLFIDSEGTIVHIVHRAEPLTTELRPSKKPAKYVLELKGGEAKEHGITTGDKVTFVRLP